MLFTAVRCGVMLCWQKLFGAQEHSRAPTADELLTQVPGQSWGPRVLLREDAKPKSTPELMHRVPERSWEPRVLP